MFRKPVSDDSLPKRQRLGQEGKILAEYVWLGGDKTTGGFDIRQKTRSLDKKPTSPADLPVWNFDGSSTGQAPGHDSEVLMKPVAIFRDPFRGGDNILVLCECLNPKMEAIATNSRSVAKSIFDKKLGDRPWFGIEQEYSLFEKNNRAPYGWPRGGYPGPQGPYYCTAGTDVAYGRHVMEAHLEACLYAGIQIAGTNAESMPAQWEFQIGPSEGIDSGDHLWMARYLLIRICEEREINVSFDPKPIPGDWAGAGGHVNYSTAVMRAPNGYGAIIKAIGQLEAKHSEHIKFYGAGNERRLTGKNETAHIDKFTYGVGDRMASVRIPNDVKRDGCGYFEDRRPASNMDPYIVTSKIFQATCLE